MKVYPEVKSQTDLSSLRVSCKRALGVASFCRCDLMVCKVDDMATIELVAAEKTLNHRCKISVSVSNHCDLLRMKLKNFPVVGIYCTFVPFSNKFLNKVQYHRKYVLNIPKMKTVLQDMVPNQFEFWLKLSSQCRVTVYCHPTSHK